MEATTSKIRRTESARHAKWHRLCGNEADIAGGCYLCTGCASRAAAASTVLAEDVAVLTEQRQWYKPASNVGVCGSSTDGATTMPTKLVGTTPVMTGSARLQRR